MSQLQSSTCDFNLDCFGRKANLGQLAIRHPIVNILFPISFWYGLK